MSRRAILPLLLLALAGSLAAAGGEGEAAHHVDWLSVLGKVLNSAILFGGLILLLRKPLQRMLTQKGEGIRVEFAERARTLEATEARLREVETRLSRVAAEVQGIQAEAEAAGKAELERLEAAGRREAERIVALGEEEIRQRVDAAVREIRGRIADLAIGRFRRDLEQGLDAAAQQKIIERNIDACGGLSRPAADRSPGDGDEGK
jgi:F0F1-type ATP synthase membrane subunit b/b'